MRKKKEEMKELRTNLSFKACYALFGFSPGLVQDGFLGVMISCCQQIGPRLKKGSISGATRMTEDAG